VWVTVHASAGDLHDSVRIRVALNDGVGPGAPTATPTPTPNVPAQVRVKTWVDDAVRNPTWIAYQEASGAWQALSPTTAGNFTFTVSSAGTRYGVAMACDAGGNVDVRVFFGTPVEADDVVLACDGPNQTSYTVSGDVIGATAEDVHVHLVGDSHMEPFAVTGMTYSVTGAAGTRDLVAYTTDTVTSLPVKGVDMRNLVLTSAATIDVDVTTSEFTPLAQTVQVTNSSGMVLTHASFWTDDGTQIGFEASATTLGYVAFPEQETGDVHHIFATEDRNAAVGGTPIRRAQHVFSDMPLNVTTINFAAIGQYTSPVAETAATTPYARLRANLGAPNAGASFYRATFDDGTIDWEVTASTGWLGTATTFEMPFFAGVGFNTAWGFTAGNAVDWAITAVTSLGAPLQGTEIAHAALGRPTEAPAVANLTVTLTGTRGTITP